MAKETTIIKDDKGIIHQCITNGSAETCYAGRQCYFTPKDTEDGGKGFSQF